MITTFFATSVGRSVRYKLVWLLALLCVSGAIHALEGSESEDETATMPLTGAGERGDWRNNWGVEDNFTIEVDTSGYHFPTAIVFVPEPGPAPDDPLYFVTELRGQIKVVTNDRSVHVFAKDFYDVSPPKEELPSGQGQTGLAGMCLDPRHGYLFATFAYFDKAGILRNNMIRFESKPGSFSLQPTARRDYSDIFEDHYTGLAHQIGPCQVVGDTIFVSVGEGWVPLKARNIDEMFGKVIRMTLDGEPVPDNPFYEDSNRKKVRNYVWAYGLRNPFSLKVVNDRVFVADNGYDVDRFLELERGADYLWQGNDKSIASNAAFVFTRSLGPVQMDYLDSSGDFPGDFRAQFYVGLSAFNRDGGKLPGVMRIPYSVEGSRISDIPRYFVQYKGSDKQMVTGVAFGPDGLYFSPLYPVDGDSASVLRVRFDPQSSFPTRLTAGQPVGIMIEKGCVGCHTIDNKYGFGTNAGPPLNSDSIGESLLARLNSPDYVASVQELHDSVQEPLPEYRAAREEVLAAQGMDRVRAWLKYRIMEPRFDNLYSQMPNQGLTEQEALTITRYFLDGEGLTHRSDKGNRGLLGELKHQARRLLRGDRDHKHLLLWTVIGFGLGLSAAVAIWIAFIRPRTS